MSNQYEILGESSMGRERNGESNQNPVDANTQHFPILYQSESQEGKDSGDEDKFQEAHQEVTQETDHPILLYQNHPKGP
jgi:hypothetical protein